MSLDLNTSTRSSDERKKSGRRKHNEGPAREMSIEKKIRRWCDQKMEKVMTLFYIYKKYILKNVVVCTDTGFKVTLHASHQYRTQPPAGCRATHSAQGCRGVTHVHNVKMKTCWRAATTELNALHITELMENPLRDRENKWTESSLKSNHIRVGLPSYFHHHHYYDSKK